MSTSQWVAPSGAAVTPLALPDIGSQNLVAEVLGAGATATTYLLNCAPGVDGTECGTYDLTVTLGPWASETVPPGAAETGALDFYMTRSDAEDPFEFSVHCEMSRTVALDCTTINIGGNDDGRPTATYASPEDLDNVGMATLVYQDVTITAGQELFQSAASTPTTEETSDGQTSGAATASGTGDGSSDAATAWGLSRWAAAGAVAAFALLNGVM